jgi:hypothetical protein
MGGKGNQVIKKEENGLFERTGCFFGGARDGWYKTTRINSEGKNEFLVTNADQNILRHNSSILGCFVEWRVRGARQAGLSKCALLKLILQKRGLSYAILGLFLQKKRF